MSIRLTSAALALALLATLPAQAGPPFLTDDPDPLERGHFEINFSSLGLFHRGGGGGMGALIDANWGALSDLQLHVQVAAADNKISGKGLSAGYGDTELGAKYRFVDQEEGWQPEIGIYPMLELPTGDAGRGLGAGHAQAFLPLWIQKDVGDWTTYGGAGYWLNHAGSDRNYWYFGWMLGRKLTDDLMLGGEVFRQTASTLGGTGTSGFNLGGTWDLNETSHILFSAGRGLVQAAATDRFTYYLGYQLTF